MRSGELARACGVNVEGLRYQCCGLLPEPPRPGSGYREYTPQAVERIRLIRQA